MAIRKPDKTITVNHKALIRHIFEHCEYYFYNYIDGASCRKKVKAGMCRIHELADREFVCPDDCPHLASEEYSCDKGRCPYVRATLKRLQTPDGF